MKLLSVFSCLRLRTRTVLRAYQYRSGGGGNGIIWAMPEDLPFPEPDGCPRVENRFLGPPKPPGALDDVMEAIEGDGSAWSYLSASLFAREAAEFGAMWHGQSWSVHVILGQEPSQSSRTVTDYPREWKWLEPKPLEWNPSVQEERGIVRVRFYTFSGLGGEAIYRHKDTYKPSGYQFKSEREVLAQGPGGYIF